MVERYTTAAGRPTHVHGRGCPGKGVALTDAQFEESYRYHREQFEAQLVHQLAARKRYNAGRRPGWWWRFSDQAAAYRANPEGFENVLDYSVSSVTVPEAWMRAGIARRRIKQLGQLRYLARQGLLQPWEAEHIIQRGESEAGKATLFGVEARVVREALARKASP
jgi:hypothetical protein